MKSRSVLPLLAVLAVLVGLIVYENTHQDRPKIQERVKALLPADLSKSNIAKLVISTGSNPEEAVTLVRDESNPDVWRVPSRFNAPVKKQKIDAYLDALTGAKGEFRAEAASDDALEQYDLTEAKAFAIAAFTKDAEKPAFKLLIGKAPSPQQIFVRLDGARDVFVLDRDLRADAGVYSQGGRPSDSGPKADVWLDKQVVSLDKTKVTKLAFHTPYRDLVLERKAKEKAEEDTSEKPQPANEYEWAVAQGGAQMALKPNAADGVAAFLSTLNATDIVDPAKKPEWGLDTPMFTCAVSIEGADKDIVIEGACPDPTKDGYVRVRDAKDDIVYKLSAPNFARVFGKATDLFTLGKLDFDKQVVQRVEVKSPTGNFVLAKVNEIWTVESPKSNKKAQTATIDAILLALSSLKAMDYADSDEGKGLDAPARSVSIDAGDKKCSVVCGNDATGFSGLYARLDKQGPVVLLNQSDLARIFVPTNDLFDNETPEK